MDKKVSVIVPVYNSSAYIRKCLDAILGQTYKNTEIILVNDGSTDDSLEILKEYAAEDARIIVKDKSNGGSSSARNMGISEISGDFVCFCDSDDYYEPTMIEKLAEVFDKHEDAIIAQCMSVCRNDDGTLFSGPYKESGEIVSETNEEFLRELLLHVGDSSFCTKMIKAEFMKNYRFSEGRLNEDFELLIKMIGNFDRIYTYETVGYNIILRFGSNTRNVYKENFYKCMIENSDMAYEFVTKEYPKFTEEARKFQLYQRLDYALHTPLSKMKNSSLADKVLKELKVWRKDIKRSPYLMKKDRRNLLILSYVPKFSKRVHRIIMKFKGIQVEK